MNAAEIERAYAIWRADLESFELEDYVPEMKSRTGWLRSIRKIVCYSGAVLARRLRSHSAGAFEKYERLEFTEQITIEQLRFAANALDCELVYLLRPCGRRHFSRIIWDQLQEQAQDALANRNVPPAMRSHALATVARQLFEDPEFRREKGWSRRMLLHERATSSHPTF